MIHYAFFIFCESIIASKHAQKCQLLPKIFLPVFFYIFFFGKRRYARMDFGSNQTDSVFFGEFPECSASMQKPGKRGRIIEDAMNHLLSKRRRKQGGFSSSLSFCAGCHFTLWWTWRKGASLKVIIFLIRWSFFFKKKMMHIECYKCFVANYALCDYF